MTVTIAPDHVSVRSGQRSGSAKAPFSCSHLLVSDVDILEEAIGIAFKAMGLSAWFTFPIVTVAVSGRNIHTVEARAIREAFVNAGALDVTVEQAKPCREGEAERSAFVAEIMRNR